MEKKPVFVSASSLHIIPGALLFYHPQRPDLIELSLLQFPTPNMVYDGPWKLLFLLNYDYMFRLITHHQS